MARPMEKVSNNGQMVLLLEALSVTVSRTDLEFSSGLMEAATRAMFIMTSWKGLEPSECQTEGSMKDTSRRTKCTEKVLLPGQMVKSM